MACLYGFWVESYGGFCGVDFALEVFFVVGNDFAVLFRAYQGWLIGWICGSWRLVVYHYRFFYKKRFAMLRIFRIFAWSKSK